MKIEKIPLSEWLLKKAQEWACVPKPGTKKFGNNNLDGWYISTSGEYSIFWVAEHHRTLAEAKYILPKGSGVMPTVFLATRGIVLDLNKQIPPDVLQTLVTKGLVLVEGWKGGLALGAAGFNSCTTGGCSCGVATIEKLAGWGIPPNVVKYIFPDSDILSNPHVTKGYQDLLDCLQTHNTNPTLVLPPPASITDSGDILVDKQSPDDWLLETDTLDIVFKKTKTVNITSINKFHEKIVNFYSQEINHVKISTGHTNPQVNMWLFEQLQNKFMYCSETRQYFFYNSAGYWENPNAQGLLDRLIANAKDIPWSYRTLENALKVIAPKFLNSSETIRNLFSKRQYIGFINGVFNLNTQQFSTHSADFYLGGLLPFEFSKTSVSPTQKLQTICPRLCTWLIDRANNQEIYANILVAFLLLAILDIRNPERFLFLSGYSATGKSTYLKLLCRVLPKNKIYSITYETITTAFGLQDLTGMGKSLIIFHDLGEKVSAAFINILRNLVSSGESQNVSRKFETTATIQFDGLIAAASNKNPFSHQQREGLADRRMIYVPFVNRVPPAQIQSFETMFPTEELQAFTAFAVQQDPHLILQFIRTINQDAFVRQGLLDSYKENRRSLYLQNFIRDKITYAPEEWVIFGSTEDDETGETLYSAYLLYTKEKGANFIDILSFNSFRQEFLPLLNSLYGFWEVYERRRLHNNKRKIGLLNIGLCQKPPKFSGEHSIDLSPYRAAPFWLDGDQPRPLATNGDQPRPLATNGDQPRPLATIGDQQRPLATIGDQQRPLATIGDQQRPLATNGDQPVETSYNLFDTIYNEDVAQSRTVYSLIATAPSLSPAENPVPVGCEVCVDPETHELADFFETNPLVALDIEFSMDPALYKRKLAYIQLYGLETKKSCLLTHKKNFTGFQQTFFPWLQKSVLCIGFFMVDDLALLWAHFSPEYPISALLYKCFDLYMFFKFLHNGFKNANSLKDWAYRLCGFKLDKTLQKTDWFQTPYSEEIQTYLLNDVWVLHYLLTYVKQVLLRNDNYINTWTHETENYFKNAYILDQILLPCFVEVSLQGITLDVPQLNNAMVEADQETDVLLNKLELTAEIYKSSQQFTEHLTHKQGPLTKLLQIWPKTNDGYFSRSKKTLRGWLTKHAHDSLFEDLAVIEWLNDFFALGDSAGLQTFFKQMKKSHHKGLLTPLWDIQGTETGRISASSPALHNTPRDFFARRCIVPSKPNLFFVIVDYKTIELAIQAVLAEEVVMLDVFLKKYDLHSFLAAKILGKSYDHVLQLKEEDPQEFKRLRNSMKPVNFGLIYGMGASALWESLLTNRQQISFADAQHMHNTWHTTFPAIKSYQKRCKNNYSNSFAALPKLGATPSITSVRGRVRRPQQVNDKSFLKPTQIVNFPIQATCADFLKTALRLIYAERVNNRLNAKLVLTAHDEIILECSEADIPAVRDSVKQIMVMTAQKILAPLFRNAPIEVDIGVGKSWADKP